jgi:hypothetical protein
MTPSHDDIRLLPINNDPSDRFRGRAVRLDDFNRNVQFYRGALGFLLAICLVLELNEPTVWRLLWSVSQARTC